MTTTNATDRRVLLCSRLSRIKDKDEPNRLGRDEDAASVVAKAEGVTIVGVADDGGVSGAKSPFKRPKLGPWLNDAGLIDQYTELWFSTIDRVGRDARDLHKLQEWCDDHGKVLRILTPMPLQWPVPAGPAGSAQKMVWEIMGIVAEMEREMIKARYAGPQKVIEENGALFGKPSFGFVAVGEKYNKTMALDDRLVPYLRGMVERALRGDTLASIAEWLNDEGVIPVKDRTGDEVLAGHPLDHAWAPSSVSNVLRNPALKGRRLGVDGSVKLKFDSLLTSAQYAELQAALDSRPQRRGPVSKTTALLTGIVECRICHGPMYRLNSTRKDKTHTYYRCTGTDRKPSTCRNMMELADVDQHVQDYFLPGGVFATTPMVDTVVVPGDDHADEIAEIEAAARELDPFADNDKREALRAERDRLMALPSEPAQIIERPTGETAGQVWARSDIDTRRRLLVEMKATVKVMSETAFKASDGADDGPPVEFYCDVHPDKLAIRLQRIMPTAA